jgi:hypothetical protein
MKPRSVSARLLTFAKAYAEVALWATTDHNDKPLNKRFNIDSFSESVWLVMLSQCADFLSRPEVQQLADNWGTEDYRQAGHDFFLTRNRHGAGFQDGHWGDSGKPLAQLSHQFGESQPYDSCDGELYFV